MGLLLWMQTVRSQGPTELGNSEQQQDTAWHHLVMSRSEGKRHAYVHRVITGSDVYVKFILVNRTANIDSPLKDLLSVHVTSSTS